MYICTIFIEKIMFVYQKTIYVLIFLWVDVCSVFKGAI